MCPQLPLGGKPNLLNWKMRAICCLCYCCCYCYCWSCSSSSTYCPLHSECTTMYNKYYTYVDNICWVSFPCGRYVFVNSFFECIRVDWIPSFIYINICIPWTHRRYVSRAHWSLFNRITDTLIKPWHLPTFSPIRI